MHTLIDFIVSLVGELGYIGIFIMMMIESSFIPFPSEIAMIPAGYLASQGEMVFITAFIAGTLGALLGAIINYGLGYYLGAPVLKTLIHKFGKYIFLKESHYTIAENYFEKHGAITTLLARFIPAVRQLISLPAGTFHMHIGKFLFYTGIGAGTWNLILMAIGYVAGENSELISKYSSQALAITLLGSIIMGVGYYFIHKYFDKKYK
ncbi:DedA family protein [Candidatus Gracilibacteria bacterium]|nr:DedA family protein [Candidatus Gracilibacteria bacterium]